MDTIIRAFYEGTTYDLDIAEDLPLRLDVSAVEAGEIGSFFGVGSQEFYLPGTRNNNRFFNHAYNISSDDVPAIYNSVQAYVIKKGETVLEGQLQLLEVVSNINTEYVTYKCTIVDSVVSFKDQLASKLIKDADWSAYSHSISSQSILDSWEGNLNGGSIFYPFADYGYDTSVDQSNLPRFGFIPLGNPTVGQYLNQPFTPLLPLQLIPSVRAKDVVDVIFDQVNFIPTGSWYEDGDTNNLFILPKGQEEGGVTISEGLTPTFTAYMSNFPLQSVSSSAYSTIGDDIQYNQVAINNLNQYDTSCYRYETKGVGTHRFNASIAFFNPVWNSPGQTVKVKIKIVAGSKICSGPGSSSSVKFSNEVELTSADGFNSFTLEAGGEDFVTVPGQDWWVYVEYTYSTSGPVPNLTLYAGNFICNKAPQVYDGATVQMGEQFDATTKSLDLIKGLLQQFNLVLTPDPANERAIRIDYFDQWVRDGRFVDWTEKYDTSKRQSVNHTIDEVERTITFKQEKDEDRFNKLATEQVPNLEYGSIEVIADNNLSQGEKSIGSYFAPLILQAPYVWDSTDANGNPTWNIDTSINMAFPALYKLDNNNIKTFKFKPRIGYKTEIDITNNYRIYFGNPGAYETLSGSYYTLTNSSDYPAITNSSKDTLFNNTFGDFVSPQANLTGTIDSFNDNWKTYVDSLYWEGSKKLTIDVEFNSNEYKDIRLNDKVFIKDNYYRINKIKGFNVSQDDVATVELIKLYPAYFQQNVVGVPVPVAPVAPVAPSPPTPVPLVTPAPTIAPVSPSPAPGVAPTAPTPVTPVPIQPRPPVTIGTYYLTNASGTNNTCALSTNQVVYALSSNVADLGVTVNTLYADPNCTVPFNGNGYYFGVSATSGVLPDAELVVMGTGVITSRTDCPTVTPVPTSAGEFYRGPGRGSSTTACGDSVDQGSLFVPYAPSVEYVQSNDYVYTDAGFTTTFSGSNSWYGLSNPGVPTAQMAIQVNDFGRVVSRIDCVPLPPAPPPPTPQPAPITVGTFYLSDAFGSAVGCSSNTDGFEVYANTTNIDDILSGSVTTLYSDANLSTGFFGNGYYYGVSDISSGSAKGSLVILGTGAFTVDDICTTVPPAPTSPGQFRRTDAQISSTNTCPEETDGGTLFVQYAPSIGYVDAGDYLYTDAGFSNAFTQSTNSWYGMSDPTVAYTQRAVQVNTSGRVITTSDCVPIAPVAPIPTPAPVSVVEEIYLSNNGYTTVSGACADPLAQTAYYDSTQQSSSFARPWTAGEKIYADSGLTTPFTGSFLYWNSRPIISASDPNFTRPMLIFDDGKAYEGLSYNCGTIPPVTSFKFGMTPAVNNYTLACTPTASIEVYSATTFGGLTSGDYVYYDDTLTTPVTGSNYVAFAILTGSAPTKTGFVTNAGNILSMITCSVPPPVTSYEYKATSGFLGVTGSCQDLLDAYTFYSSRSDWSQIVATDVLYSDATLSTPTTLGGNGLYYGIGDSSMTYPSSSILMSSTQVNQVFSCAGIPTPPPPVPISNYYQYELFPCTGSGAIYRNSNVSASAGTVVQLSGSSAHANCYTINSTIIRTGTTTEQLETTTFADCTSCTTAAPTPTPTPAPVTAFTIYNNAGYSSATGCNFTVTNTRFAATSSAHLQNGDFIYTNSGLTSGFDGNNLNFGFGDTASGDPAIQAFVSATGQLSQVTVCPPPPTPVTSYSHDRSDFNQFSSGVCSDSFTGTVYTSVSWANIGIGTVIYTDSGLTTTLDGTDGQGVGSGYWRVGDTSNSYILLINGAGQVSNVFFCQ